MSFLRRHWLLSSLGALGLLALLLVLLALPLRSVPDDAQAAQDELTLATEALKAGDPEVAFDHVEVARGHVDEVTESTDGIGAKVWSVVPVAGSGVRDVRHLATAMDELTSAMEVTEELYPQVSGEESELLVKGSVNLGVLDTSLAGVDEIGTHLRTALGELDEVDGDNLLVGDTTTQARDSALEKVEPAVETLDRIDPLLAALPGILGGEGSRDYVVAMMNPAEMKFAGGSMLTFTEMSLDTGTLRRGRTRDIVSAAPLFKQFTWKNVDDNPFASPFAERITHANTAPSWPVAGEETLRAWDILTRQEADGLIALDIQAMARLLEATGPLQVKGLGEVTSENLVVLTAGEYARFGKDDQADRKALNKALVPAFMKRLFSGVDFIDTVQALNDSANGRHLALYFRDDVAQEAAGAVGFDGDLSDSDQDYIGFFTQNLVGSKADFFQQKKISSDVRLREDGSARVTLTATVDNQGPESVDGELHAYTDPMLDIRLGAFLPRGATLRSGEVTSSTGVAALDGDLTDYFGRPYLTHDVVIPAGESSTMRLVYDVPTAATLKGDRLTYGLDMDPHPTVKEAQVDVTVHWPEGFAADSLPKGWTAAPRGAVRWTTPAWGGITAWRVTAEK